MLQDHYVLGADKAVRQVSLYASARQGSPIVSFCSFTSGLGFRI